MPPAQYICCLCITIFIFKKVKANINNELNISLAVLSTFAIKNAKWARNVLNKEAFFADITNFALQFLQIKKIKNWNKCKQSKILIIIVFPFTIKQAKRAQNVLGKKVLAATISVPGIAIFVLWFLVLKKLKQILTTNLIYLLPLCYIFYTWKSKNNYNQTSKLLYL